MNVDDKTFELVDQLMQETSSDNIDDYNKKINTIPFHYREKVLNTIEDYLENKESSQLIIKLKSIILNKLGKKFAEKRDEVRWIGNYGYDCANEDITNFLASYIKLNNDYNEWKAKGEGQEPSTYYKVYISKEPLNKKVVPLTFSEMDQVYSEVRNSQFAAYAWLETERTKLDSINSYYNLKKMLQNLEG